jgi:hypothetical protein
MKVTETIHQRLLNCDVDLIVITQHTGIATSILSRMARNETKPATSTNTTAKPSTKPKTQRTPKAK